MIKVAVVDDHSVFRKGVINVLSKNENIEIVAEANNGKEFIDLLSSVTVLPDVLLLDIQMPVMNGYETLDYVHSHYPKMKVIMISLIQDQITVNNLLEKGASGFISKNAEPEAIMEVIEKSVAGNTETIIIPGQQKIDGKAPETPVLTDKEYELLKYSSTGLTYEQIASYMAITPKALDHHRTSLFRKLNIQSRQELASIAVKMGLAD